MKIAPTRDLPPHVLENLKRLCENAYGHPLAEDWDHALGGRHFLIDENGEPLSHASVVERRLETGRWLLRTGYVEAVATRRDRQGRGLASRIMNAIADYVRAEFELGGLCTGENGFYERLGWETWRGPTFVRTEDGLLRTEQEDGNAMILRTPWTPEIDIAAALSCEWRPGDVW